MPIEQSELRRRSPWDALRAAASTPDRETFQQGGFFGLMQKIGAQTANAPGALLDLLKASPQLALLIARASQPQGLQERSAMASMLGGMAQNAIENPVSTAGSFVGVPGGAYAGAREVAYAKLPPHVMMYMRSMMPWYENQPWTRVPPKAAEVFREAPMSVQSFHDTTPNNADQVRKMLEPYLRGIGEDPRVAAPAGSYGVPHGLAETVGGAFVTPVSNAPVPTMRILDDLRWYLSPEHFFDTKTKPGISGSLPKLLGNMAKNPKQAVEAVQSLAKPGPMSGYGEKFSYGSGFGREDVRNLLEAIVARHGHSFPIDWKIPL